MPRVKHWSFRILLVIFVALLLGACAQQGAAPTATPAEEQVEPSATAEEGAAQEAASPTPEPEAASPTPETATEEEPTEFVFAHSGPIRTLDAPVTWYGSTHWLTNLLYDCLIWRQPDGSGYVGQAAEDWERIDPTTWRFYLREGLTFHNGEPLDAEAVKWNIDRVRTREDFMVQPQWEFVKDVKIIDDLTVEITTNEPHAYFLYDVSYNGCELLPPDYMEEVGEEQFAQEPVGSGPYKLVEFTADDRYVFEAWDDYHGGRPEVDRVIYQVIPEKSSQIAALLSGQVDMIAGVPVPDVDRLEQAEGIKLMQETSNRMHHLYLRTQTETGDMAEEYPDYQPATLDKNIRQAISHALDRNLLAEVQGNAMPTLVRVAHYAPEAFADQYVGSDVADEWYDPELAKQLIKEAGYDPDAGDRPTLYFDSPAENFGNEKEVAETISAMLEDVGFEVELNVRDSSAHFEQIVEPGTNRDMLLVTLGGGPSLVPLFYTCDWEEPTYHVCVEEWSELSNEILTTVDEEERLNLWKEWWEYYLDVAQTVTLYEIQNTYAINSEFEWTPRADGWMTFRDLKVAK